MRFQLGLNQDSGNKWKERAEHCWREEQFDSLRRKLTLGLQGTVKKLNLVQEIFSTLRTTERWSWKDLRDQCGHYLDAEIEAL